MDLVDRITSCRRFDPAGFVPLRVEGRELGAVRRSMRSRLAAYADVFVSAGEGLGMHPGLDDFDARTRALAAVASDFAAEGVIPPLRGEWFPVVETWGGPCPLKVDRAAAALFGFRAFGVHLNGYVVDPQDGDLRVWLARRSNTVSVDPGRLDHLVAGGQPFGLTLRENLEKEAAEEAGLPAGLVAEARPSGHFSYQLETAAGVKNDTIFSFDLAVPPTFSPQNHDGEIVGFELVPATHVLEGLRRPDAFKFNVAPVLLGFLARHGALDVEQEEAEAILGALAG